MMELDYLGLDLSCIPSEKRQEALLPTIDNVDLVQRNRMNDFLALLQLSFLLHRKPSVCSTHTSTHHHNNLHEC
jgi:hypothetical protein